MILRDPVLISTVAAIPGERLTRLFSMFSWVRSSDTRAEYINSCPFGSLLLVSAPCDSSTDLSGLSRTMASCETLRIFPCSNP